jgi:hypothetical protein
MDQYNSKLAKLFGLFNGESLYAVTIGQTAYYSCDESLVHPAWRAHENQHKVQWARDGKIKFLSRYIWQLITKGYENIDYEIEARAAVNKQNNKGD